MNRKLLLWFVPAAVFAASSLVVYRSIQAKPDNVVVTKTSEMLMMPSHGTHGTASESEHEISALWSDLEKNPNHVPILLRMAQVSRDLGKLNDSTRYLQDAVKQDPKHKEARLELGRALYDTGDSKGAIRETRRLLEMDSSNVDALYNLGAIYGNLSQDQRAREYWEKAAAISPDSDSGRRARENLQQLR
jgi:Flp pilus assembly protein TadD